MGDPSSIPGPGRSSRERMAARSSILAWEIPWTEQPGGLQSKGPQRVRQDWLTLIVISFLTLLEPTLITNDDRNFFSGNPDTLSKSKAATGDHFTILCVHSFPGEMSILNILYEANFRCLLDKLTWIIHTCHIKYQHRIKHPVHKIVLELPYIWWSIHCLLSIYSKPGTFIDATHSEVEAEKKKTNKKSICLGWVMGTLPTIKHS